jgi:hypothetical protein
LIRLRYIPAQCKSSHLPLPRFFATASAFAGGQHVIPDYATAQRSFFWTKLYVNGGRDLYCNVRFLRDQRLTVEHVYAADWIADHFDCANRNCGHPTSTCARTGCHQFQSRQETVR